MLIELTENKMIQEGLLGRFLPIIKSVAGEALERYSTQESAL